MAQKLSITIFVYRSPKNQTFLKTACKKVNKSKRPPKDWASCAILSQSTAHASSFISYKVKLSMSSLYISLFIRQQN